MDIYFSVMYICPGGSFLVTSRVIPGELSCLVLIIGHPVIESENKISLINQYGMEFTGGLSLLSLREL